jgi:Reverse transcriptase (RNA-dependent DNA polymerase)
MALVTHFDLELHQMDIKTAFLNDDIDECIYMSQALNYESDDSKQIVCKLKKSIYGFKQASHLDLSLTWWMNVYITSLVGVSLYFWFYMSMTYYLPVMIKI